MDKILYYCFGGGLGHITRFRAFCHTLKIKPHLLTNTDVFPLKVELSAESISVLPVEYGSDKAFLRKWFLGKLKEIRPEKVIVDAFPGGILGELCGLLELDNVEIEYIARILRVDSYEKRLCGQIPRISKIWQVENFDKKQTFWLKELALQNKSGIERLELEYPVSTADFNILLPENTWLIVHSGSEEELFQLWEFANETALLEQDCPNFVVVGQSERPAFLKAEIPYYSIYPIGSLLEKAERVVSAAGFNIIQQMKDMRHKHLVLPLERALDNQYQRLIQVGLAH